MPLTKLRKPCCRHRIEAKADEHPQRGNVDEHWSIRAEELVSVKVQECIWAVRKPSENNLPSVLRIALNNKVLKDRRHHQRCTAEKEIACQKNHVVEGVLVRHAKDHGTDDDQHNW